MHIRWNISFVFLIQIFVHSIHFFKSIYIWKKKKQLKQNIQVNCDTWIGKLSHTYSLIAFKIVIKVFGFYYNGTLVASIAFGRLHWTRLKTIL